MGIIELSTPPSIARQPRRWWLLLLPGILWLLFFPNAPYLVTDLIHLRSYPPVPAWYDIGLLISFAWTGCFLAVASLYSMHQIIRDYTGRSVSWLIVAGMIGLCGLGIYVGRFLRWNSWDLLQDPLSIAKDMYGIVRHPMANLPTYVFTILFTLLFLFIYVTIVLLGKVIREQGTENREANIESRESKNP